MCKALVSKCAQDSFPSSETSGEPVASGMWQILSLHIGERPCSAERRTCACRCTANPGIEVYFQPRQHAHRSFMTGLRHCCLVVLRMPHCMLRSLTQYVFVRISVSLIPFCVLRHHPLSESLSRRGHQPEPVAWCTKKHVTRVPHVGVSQHASRRCVQRSCAIRMHEKIGSRVPESAMCARSLSPGSYPLRPPRHLYAPARKGQTEVTVKTGTPGKGGDAKNG